MSISIRYATGINSEGDREEIMLPEETERRLESSIQPFVDREADRLAKMGYVPEEGITAVASLLAQHGQDDIKVMYFAGEYPLLMLEARSFEGGEWVVTGAELPERSFCKSCGTDGMCEI